MEQKGSKKLGAQGEKICTQVVLCRLLMFHRHCCSALVPILEFTHAPTWQAHKFKHAAKPARPPGETKVRKSVLMLCLPLWRVYIPLHHPPLSDVAQFVLTRLCFAGPKSSRSGCLEVGEGQRCVETLC